MVKNKQLVVADEKTMAVKKPANKKAVVSNKRTTMEWVNGQLNVLQEEQQAVFSADGAVMKQVRRCTRECGEAELDSHDSCN